MASPFALVLHTHLPMVVNHGRWPHGSDWLCEAAFECYLPLLETAHRLVADGISPKWTINLSPVLTEQLASPEFQKELSFYHDNVRRACTESRSISRAPATGDRPLTHFWEEFFERMWEMHRRIGGDIPGTFAELQRGGHVEIITCAATHGYLPLLARDESIQLQLRTAVETHRRHFGRAPRGSGCRSAPTGPGTSGRRRPGPRAAATAGAARHRGDAGQARARILHRRRSPGVGRPAHLPLPRLLPLYSRTR
jgi:1,4-alpha-glucan branching enzyme